LTFQTFPGILRPESVKVRMLRKFLLWFPVYWVLTLAVQLISALTFTMGAIAGALLFGLVFALPPQSVALGLLFVALVLGLGFYSQSRLGKRWGWAISRIAERIERDI